RVYSHGAAKYDFVMSGLSAWVFSQRRDSQDGAATLVDDLLALGTTAKKLQLLRMLYGAHCAPDEALVTSISEIALIRRHRSLFAEANAAPDYIACTLWGLRHDWPGLRSDLAVMLQRATREARAAGTRQLVKGLHRVVKGDNAVAAPPDLLRWFWQQLVETAGLGFIERDERWHIEELQKVLGKAPVQWLVAAVRRRATQ